jgi:hypothetical protein
MRSHYLIENYEGFANGIDDSFFQGTIVLGSGHRIILDHRWPSP